MEKRSKFYKFYTNLNVVTLVNLGRYQEAVDDLTEAIRIDPSFEDAKLNLHQANQDWKNTTVMENS